jgi:transcription antitermination factor NusG
MPKNNSEYQWYAVTTRPRFELRVEASCSGKGFETLLPLSKKHNKVGAPLFRTYTFAKFDARFRLPILQIPGVTGIVGTRSGPIPVPPKDIENLRNCQNGSSEMEPWGTHLWQRGQLVRITEGALAGVEGHIVEIKNRHKLVVGITMLQRALAVTLNDTSVIRTAAEIGL